MHEPVQNHNMNKTLENTTASQASKNVRDIQFWGNGDTFQLISKAWSKAEGWMKSTKAMDVGTGVVVQVSTHQGDNIAEAVTFVPDVKIVEIETNGDITGRVIIPK